MRGRKLLVSLTAIVMLLMSATAAMAALRAPGSTVLNPPTPKITVTSPLGGAKWNAGTRHDITWTWSGDANYFVHIYLQRGTETPIQIAYKAGGGKANCLIPAGVAAGTDYRVIVASVNNPNVKGVSGAFAIQPAPSIVVTTPNGGEEWHRGSTYNITWTYTGNPEKVKILLVPDNNMIDGKLIAEVLPGANGAGTYAWKIPADLELRADYRIWVVYSVGSNDISDQNFTIAPATVALQPGLVKVDISKLLINPAITLTSPVEWTKLQRGQTYKISWTVTGDCGDLADIYLTIWSDKKIVDTIAANVQLSSGSVNWTVPWYDDQKMADLKPNGWIAVQARKNPDIAGRIRITVE